MRTEHLHTERVIVLSSRISQVKLSVVEKNSYLKDNFFPWDLGGKNRDEKSTLNFFKKGLYFVPYWCREKTSAFATSDLCMRNFPAEVKA